MSTTLHQSYPTARRPHRCSPCGRPIKPGERYSRWKGTSELWPGVGTSKECSECCERYGRPIPALPSREQGATEDDSYNERGGLFAAQPARETNAPKETS